MTSKIPMNPFPEVKSGFTGDLDTITKNGIYALGSANSITNGPSSDYQYCEMMVFGSTQMIIGNSHIWVRYIGSAWKGISVS